MTAWDQSNPANVPAQMAMNMEASAPGGTPSRPATGAVTVKPDFLTALQHYESGGRNIPNVHQGTSSGQAQGYNQITTGTWNEFGGQQYAPDPLHATPEQQNAIAAKIPLSRWDPKTLDYLRGQAADNARSGEGGDVGREYRQPISQGVHAYSARHNAQ